MTREEAVKILQQQISRIRTVRSTRTFGENFTTWRYETEAAIKRIFGNDQGQLDAFRSIKYRDIQNSDLDTPEEDPLRNPIYREGLDHAESLLEAFVKEVQEYPTEEISQKELLPPSTITIHWVLKNASFGFWARVAGILFLIFLLGFAAAQTTFFRELIAVFHSPSTSIDKLGKQDTSFSKKENKSDQPKTTQSADKETNRKKDPPPTPITKIEQHTKGDQSPAVVTGGDVRIDIKGKNSQD
jgi:hypothetical protein